MKRLTIFLTLSFAALLAGCTKTASVNSGAGYEKQTPSPATRSFIVANDKPFARQVAAHNSTCAADPACRK